MIAEGLKHFWDFARVFRSKEFDAEQDLGLKNAISLTTKDFRFRASYLEKADCSILHIVPFKVFIIHWEELCNNHLHMYLKDLKPVLRKTNHTSDEDIQICQVLPSSNRLSTIID